MHKTWFSGDEKPQLSYPRWKHNSLQMFLQPCLAALLSLYDCSIFDHCFLHYNRNPGPNVEPFLGPICFFNSLFVRDNDIFPYSYILVNNAVANFCVVSNPNWHFPISQKRCNFRLCFIVIRPHH
nr:hypothetical protein Iba_chr06cCG3980 [Ipomoea batatas]